MNTYLLKLRSVMDPREFTQEMVHSFPTTRHNKVCSSKNGRPSILPRRYRKKPVQLHCRNRHFQILLTDKCRVFDYISHGTKLRRILLQCLVDRAFIFVGFSCNMDIYAYRVGHYHKNLNGIDFHRNPLKRTTFL